jgi:hypothetical protein
MNNNNDQFNSNLESMFDDVLKHKNAIMEDFRKQTDEKMISLINLKLTLLDTILKSIIKYRNTSFKEKDILEKQKFKNLLGKSNKCL